MFRLIRMVLDLRALCTMWSPQKVGHQELQALQRRVEQERAEEKQAHVSSPRRIGRLRLITDGRQPNQMMRELPGTPAA